MAKKQETRNSYHKRITGVIDYIHNNLDRNMTLHEISEVSCFAPYHFHRIYQSIVGETVMKSIRRFMLQRAAKELIETDNPLDRIAKKAGYDNLDSFIRKFGEDFEISPNAYRQRGRLIFKEISKPKMENKNMYNVEIVNLERLCLASIDHEGDYMNIGSKFEKLIIYLNHKSLLKEDSRSFGVYYDDPNSVPAPELKSKACFTVSDDFEDDGNIKKFEIKPAKYGVVTHEGSYAELEDVYRWLYRTWLVNSEYEVGSAPPLEEYLNNPREVPPSELITKIYVPLKDD